MIKTAPSGYCVHFDPGSKKCNIWERRPARCRLYTCRWDRSVWKDYEARVPSEKIAASLSAEVKETSHESAHIVTVEGKPGVELDRSTFHVFERDGEALLYDLSRGQIMRVNPVAFDILSHSGSPGATAWTVATCTWPHPLSPTRLHRSTS